MEKVNPRIVQLAEIAGQCEALHSFEVLFQEYENWARRCEEIGRDAFILQLSAPPDGQVGPCEATPAEFYCQTALKFSEMKCQEAYAHFCEMIHRASESLAEALDTCTSFGPQPDGTPPDMLTLAGNWRAFHIDLDRLKQAANEEGNKIAAEMFEASRPRRPPKAAKQQEKKESRHKPRPAFIALDVLKKHPEWSTRDIAKEVGCAHTTLSRNENFKNLRKLLVNNPPPRGIKTKNGQIE